MGKRLIDANKAQAVLVNMAEHLMEAGNPEMAGAVGYAAEVIGKQKTVNAVEVVHGHWEYGKWEQGHWVKGNERCRCSVCHRDFAFDNLNIWNGCPHCFAKMDS